MNENLQNEIESIKAIYDYFDAVVDPSDNSVNIDIVPYPGQPDTDNVVRVTLKLTAYEDYPNQSPTINLTKHSIRQRALEEIIRTILESHCQFEVLFDLYTAITDYLQANNVAIRSIHDVMNGVEVPVIVQQQAISAGESDTSDSDSDDVDLPLDPNAGKLADKDIVPPDYRVTEEQFKQWSAAFKQEMYDKGIWRDVNEIDIRPTGKQLFLSGTLTNEPVA